MELTDRQQELLRAVVELHVKSGEPVGSEQVEKEYDLGVSPATIRNEMVKLTEMGYLKQPHTSAGRAPTSMGYKFYISELMRERQLPVSAEVSMKTNLWQKRHEEDQLLREAVKNLATRCQMLSLAMSSNDNIYYAGAANILDWPEFEDIDVTRFVLKMFDEFPTLQQIIGQARGTDPMHVLFGDELGYEHLHPTSFVFARYIAHDDTKTGVIGVIGPARMNFPVVIPYVRYVSNLVAQALRSW